MPEPTGYRLQRIFLVFCLSLFPLFLSAQDYFDPPLLPGLEGVRFCGTVAPTVPPNRQPAGDCDTQQTIVRDTYEAGDLLIIPTVFHVIARTNGTGNIDESFIHSQVEILNEDFNAQVNTPGAPGNDSRILFVLADRDPNGQPTNGITRTFNDAWHADNDSFGYRRALNWNPDRYMNIYVNSAGGNLGYAYLPSSGNVAGAYYDGINVLWNAVGRNAPIGPPYNTGRTLTHEVGHYLGLYHTFQGGCCNSYTCGDLVNDTPSQSQPIYGCPGGTATCGSSDPVDNYMGYADDACMNRFSVEQINRMRCTLLSFRPNLFRRLPPDPVAVWISRGLGVIQDETLSVPIVVGEVAQYLDVNAFDFELNYDTNLFTYEGFTTSGTEIAGWDLVLDNEPTPGRVLVSAASTQEFTLSTDGDAILIYMNLHARADATVDACSALSLPNAAFVFNGGFPETQTSDGQLCVEAVPPPLADLSLHQTVSPDKLDNGGDVTITLRVDNAGPDSVGAVTTALTLPANMAFVSASGDGTYNHPNWQLTGVTAAGSATVAVTATFVSGDSATIVSEITASDVGDLDSNPGDGNTQDDDYQTATIRRPEADLDLRVRVSTTVPFLEQPYFYTVTVGNNGPDQAENITVSAPLPAGLSQASAQSSVGSYDAGVWSIPALPAGQSAELVLTTAAPSVGARTFTAEITAATPADPDSTPNNQNNAEDDTGSATINPRRAVGASIVITTADGNGVGFNDTTAVDPVGGNTGTTLGQQRRLVWEHAAAIVGSFLASDVLITAQVDFADLPCPGGTPVLAHGEPLTGVIQFDNAPDPDTFYPIALGNHIAGVDTNGAEPEIVVTVNPSIAAGGCLNGTDWYLGLDASPGSQVDMVSIAVRELIHGLGFHTFVNGGHGGKFFGQNDVFMKLLRDPLTNERWSAMSSSERLSAAGREQVFLGEGTRAAAGTALTAGTDGGGYLLLDFDYQGSVSDYNRGFISASATPDQVLEQFLVGANHDPGIAMEVLFDLGWTRLDQADVELTMTVDNVTPLPGDRIEFAIEVRNRGPREATGLEVSARLPAGLTYVSDDGNGAYTSGNGLWTVGTLGENQTTVLKLSVDVAASGAKQLVAELTNADQGDPDSLPNNGLISEDDTAAISVGSADLSMAISATPEKADVGETLVIRVQVTNAGPDTSENVTARVSIGNTNPTPVEILSDDGGGAFNPATGLWTIGSLDAAQTVALNVTTRVIAFGGVGADAEVLTSNLFDPDSTPGNNLSSEDDWASVVVGTPEADLSLSGTLSSEVANVGDRVQLNLTLTNSGPDASGATVTLALPGGVDYRSHSGTGTFNDQNATWTVAAEQLSSPAQLTVELAVVSFGSFTLTSEISAADRFDPDSTPGNDVPSEDDRFSQNLRTPEADLELGLTLGNGTANVGDTVQLNLDLLNRGPDDATGVQVANRLPGGLTITGSSGAGSFADGLWTVASVPADSRVTLQISARVDVAGTKVNTAEIIAADQQDPDSTVNNNAAGEDDQASATIGAIDLSVAMQSDEPQPLVGENTTVTITLANAGPDDATGVQVAVPIPAGVTLTNTPADFASGVWTPLTLAASSQVDLVLILRSDSVGAKTVTAQVVAADHGDTDSQPADGRGDDYAELVITPRATDGAPIIIVNSDAPGEGFNDPTPVSPTGGNTATTLGTQRLQVFERAAQIWGGLINSSVQIKVEARFDALTCSSSSAVLGAAGPKTVARDFPNAGFASTWYHIALANAIAGSDLNNGNHIVATFNSSIDNNNGCLANTNWYYGLDGNNGNNMDLLTVVLHELGHGLGVSTFVNGQTGAKLLGFNDIYMQYLRDASLGKSWPQMTDAERARSAVDTRDLVWTGPLVNGGAGNLTDGVNSRGQVEMYAPNPFRSGSSVSHFSTDLSPDELMEPFFTQATTNPGLAVALLGDLGWQEQPLADLSLTGTLSDTQPGLNELVTATLVLRNNGPGETGSVTAEVLADSGLTYQSHTGGGSYNPATGVWTIGDMAVGAAPTLSVVYRAERLAPLNLRAQVTNATTDDPDSTPENGYLNEDDDLTLTVEPIFIGTADLSLSATATTLTPIPGDPLSVTLELRNDGPDTAENIAVDLIIPLAFTYQSSSGDGAFDTGTRRWTLPSLPTGNTVSLTLNLLYDSGSGAFIYAGVAQVDQEDPDSTPGNANNNGEDDTITLAFTPGSAGTADLSLDLVVSDSTPEYGSRVTFTLTLDNAGPDTAEDIVVLVSPAAAFQNIAADPSWDPVTQEWRPDDLAATNQAVLTLSADAVFAGSHIFRAEVRAVRQDDPDSTPDNNRPDNVSNEDDFVITTISTLTADLELTHTVTPGNVDVEDAPVLRLSVTNRGPAASENVVVQHGLPAGLTIAAQSGDGAYDTGSGVWTIGTLNSGQTAQVEMTLTIAEVGRYKATAEVTNASRFDPDSTPGNGANGEDDYDEVVINAVGQTLTTITILNSDGPGEGFNDNTPTAPVGGNTGTTLGEQRLIAFQHAADIWARYLASPVEIVVDSRFDPLTCSASSGILGSAGPRGVARDFPNAPISNTWYPIALANALAGSNLYGGNQAAARATFNSSIDNNNNCLSGTNWYYGLDGNAGNNMDLVSVLLHEMAHGLGFLTFTNGQTGSRFYGRNDVYMQLLMDHSQGLLWSQMNDSGRARSAVDNGDLVWTGSQVNNAAGELTAGTNSSGLTRMYAPNPFRPGSSVSHFDTALAPNELMEPFYTGPNHDPGMAAQLMFDIGWPGARSADLSLTAAVDRPAALPGETAVFTLVLGNDGPNRANGIRVAIPIPSGLTYLGDNGLGTYSNGVWSIDLLDAGDTISLQITTSVNQSGDKLLVAEVADADRPDPDSVPDNGNPAEDDYAAVGIGAADLALAWRADDLSPLELSTINLHLDLTNEGPDDASAVVVGIPPFANATLLGGNNNFDLANRRWNVANLAASGTTTLTLTLQIDRFGATTPVIVANAEIIAAEPDDPDSVVANQDPAEDDWAGITLTPRPLPKADLSLTTSVDAFTLETGELLTFAIRLHNDGPALATDVAVTATYPGFSLVDANGSGTFSAGRWSLDELGAGAATTLNLILRADAFGPTTLQAEVAASGVADPDSTPANGLNAEDDVSTQIVTPVSPASALIQLQNSDGQGVGFNDATPTAPVGGNAGDTLGAQRLIAFQYAADLWSANLDSETPILIRGRFGNLACNQNDAALAQAQLFWQQDFTGAPQSGVRYPSALANTLAGEDLDPDRPDAVLTFNLALGGANCFSGRDWYYGLDGQPGTRIDFVTVVLKRLTHALGFFTDLNGADGSLAGSPERFLDLVTDRSTGQTLRAMSNSARAVAVVNEGNLVWTGAVAGAVAGSGAGVHPQGGLLLHAPNPFLAGASLIHLSQQFQPNQLMEVAFSGANHDLSLAAALLRDLGWPGVATADLELSLSASDTTPEVNDVITLTATLTNHGPDTATGLSVGLPLPGNLSHQSNSGNFDAGTGLWSPSDLSSGQQVQLTVNVQVTNNQAVTLTTQVLAADTVDPDATAGNGRPGEDDQASITLAPFQVFNADLGLTATVDRDSLLVSENFTVTLNLSNAGPDSADAVAVQVSLPGGVTLLSSNDTGGGALDSGTGLWTVGSIANGATRALTITFRADRAGTFLVGAEVSQSAAIDPDSVPNNGNSSEDDTDQVGVSVTEPPRADVSVSLATDQSSPNQGDLFTVTAKVRNDGPQAVTVTTEIRLPQDMTQVGSTLSQGSFNNGTFAPGRLAAGAEARLTLELSAASSGGKTLVFEVMSSDVTDPDATPGNGSTSEDDLAELTIFPRSNAGAVIVIRNNDGPGEGFNDTRPVSPVGGNPGTTLGEQRLIAFQRAADIVAASLKSDVTITVLAQFDALSCSSTSGVLGAAGPVTAARDFTGAPHEATWYHIALANALAGRDLNGGDGEIRATFNSSIDNNDNCLRGTNWYYGLDARPGNNMDLVSVLIHEFSHGLGFSTFVDPSGNKLLGFDDTYMRNLKDTRSNKSWSAMSNAERAASAVGGASTVWQGANVVAASGGLTNGRNGAGEVEVYAPNPYRQGSSVSHFSTSLVPDELMEPFYTGPNHEMGLAVPLFEDLGWNAADRADLSMSLSVDNPTPAVGETVTFTVKLRNDGPSAAENVRFRINVGAGLITPAGKDIDPDDPCQLNPLGDEILLDLVIADHEATFTLCKEVLAEGDRGVSVEIIASDTNDPDSTPGNGNTFEDDYAALSVGGADLSLDLLADRNSAAVGTLVNLTLTLNNAGNEEARNIAVDFSLPAGLELVNRNPAGSAGNWQIARLSAGALSQLQLTARVTDTGSHTVSAEVTASDRPDPDSTPNNGASAEDDAASLAITGTPPDSSAIGIAVNGFFSDNCPNTVARLQITLAGDPVSGLEADAFALFEDGQNLPFTLVTGSTAGEYELAFQTLQADGNSHDYDFSVTVLGSTATGRSSARTCHISGVTTLANDVPVTGIAATQGSRLYFALDVPPNQGRVFFETSGGDGDVDLYLARDRLPTLNDYDFRDIGIGNSERIQRDNPAAGRWYVGLFAVSEFRDVQLRGAYAALRKQIQIQNIYIDGCPEIAVQVQVTLDDVGVPGLTAANFQLLEDNESRAFSVVPLNENRGKYELRFTTTEPDGLTHQVLVRALFLGDSVETRSSYNRCAVTQVTPLSNGELVANLAGRRDTWLYFRIDVPNGQDVLEIRSFGGAGDADLYARFGDLPDQNVFDAHPRVGGNEQTITIENPSAGSWFIGVYGFLDYTGLNMVAGYWVETLDLTIDAVSITACPTIQVVARVEDQSGPVTGLTASAFTITENNDAALEPSSVVESDGVYRLRYDTANITGDDIFVTAKVSRDGLTAFDNRSYRNCTRDGGVIDVWINRVHAAPAGPEISLPLFVGEVEIDFQINSFQVALTYDPNILIYRGLDTAGSLIADWDVLDDSGSDTGRILLQAANVANLNLSSDLEQVLTRFRFLVVGDSNACSELALPEADFVFNNGSPIARTADGRFCVTMGCPRARGDLDGDGRDNRAFDALQILNSLSGIPTDFDPLPLCVADTNCSGTISVQDAVLILQRSVELIEGYCLDDGPATRAANFSIDIPEEQRLMETSQDFVFDLNITNLPDEAVHGYSFTMTWDPALLTFEEVVVREDSLSERWGEPITVWAPGSVTVTHAYPLTPLPGDGTLLRFRGRTTSGDDGDGLLEFSSFSLATPSEPQTTPPPLYYSVLGIPCYDTGAWSRLVGAWNNEVTILDIVTAMECVP
ncbi:M43 family zinc metalloprotease [Acanthopleuribacter pedis]|uniref:DUF11 domain-containing protein n=1 Tax=Acanthopleuribacter pedis TaxID=442870 RepID=A0A8J7PZE2_9BACT|nr:M43 family zinc metalloprotease [Acanthopleuribacter pedis]MBO1317527.1 DUF11 domain-containing protein [Acanthopleuribacter pedis]